MKRKIIFTLFMIMLEIILTIFGIVYVLNESFVALGIILLVVAGVLLVYVVSGYNKMVRFKNKIKESLALIDIQLKLRFDLIPNLVKVVKKYTDHESELIKEVVRLRKMAVSTNDEKEKLEIANKIVPPMKSLIAVAENYPELKSSALYKNLIEQLVDVEDRLVSARRIYDSNVNIYNTTIEVFPRNVLAFMFEFKKEEMFKIDAGESINVKID